MSFGRTPEERREMARRGGLTKAEAMRRRLEPLRPYAGSILTAMDDAGMLGPSWEAWRVFRRAVYALPMDAADLARFQQHTGRSTPPAAPVGEAYVVAGRRSGSIAHEWRTPGNWQISECSVTPVIDSGAHRRPLHAVIRLLLKRRARRCELGWLTVHEPHSH